MIESSPPLLGGGGALAGVDGVDAGSEPLALRLHDVLVERAR